MDIVRVNYSSLLMGSNKPRKINSISKAKKGFHYHPRVQRKIVPIIIPR